MAKRTSLNVSLTPELSRFIENRLRTGRYETASDVIQEALRALQRRVRQPVASTERLAREVETGLAQLRLGEGVDGESFFRRLSKRRRS